MILNKDKQEAIKKIIGEELYNDLYFYQKIILQIYFSKKDLKRFKCLEEYYVIKEKEKNASRKNNEDKGYT